MTFQAALPVVGQRHDRLVQAPRPPVNLSDLGRRAVEMLGEQPIAQTGNRPFDLRIAARLQREVALRVRAHRAIGKIRRADHQQLVIDDQHFAMYIETATFAIEPGQGRIVEAVATVAVGRAQHAMIAAAQRPHRRNLQPAALGEWRNHRDLGRIVFAQSPRERFVDQARGEILVLREDPAPRPGDRIQMQVSDLADGWIAVERRFGARDRDIDIGQCRFDPGRPRVGRCRCGSALRQPPGGAPPTLAGKVPQRAGTVTSDDHPHVVERRVRHAAMVDPVRIISAVAARIPTHPGQVVTADEGDGIVDNDDLLMMGCTDRVLIVETERQPPMRTPVKFEDRQPFALHRVEHGEIPREHVAAQFPPRRNDGVQEIAKRFGQPVAGAARGEPHPAVDIPAQDEERVPRLREGRAHDSEVLLAIDKKGDSCRAFDPPAIAPGGEEGHDRSRRLRAWDESSHPVAQLGDAFSFRTVVAAVHPSVALRSMADDPDTAMRAHRRERVNRAFETVENMSLAPHHNLEAFVVVVAAELAFGHECLLSFTEHEDSSTRSTGCRCGVARTEKVSRRGVAGHRRAGHQRKRGRTRRPRCR